MEKRRRARMNASLTELKALLLSAIKKEGSRQNKMEKADILEMAVKHLRQIQRQHFTGEASGDASDVHKYHLGFHACAQEVCKYLDSNCDEDLELKTKLLSHLANCMTSPDYQTTASSSSSTPSLLPILSSSLMVQVPSSTMSAGSLSSRPLLTLTSESTSSVLSNCRTGTLTHVEGSVTPRCDTAKTQQPLNDIITTSGSMTVLQKVTQSASDGILHAVLTSSTPAVLVKPRLVSLPSPGKLVNPPPVPGSSKYISDNHSMIGNIRPSQVPPIAEIKNNSIILPTFVSVSAPTTLTCLQQPSQLQHTQVYHQQHQMNQLQLQQNMQPQFVQPLPDGSNVFTSMNPFHLIPTKTANGDIAFVLSATNFISQSHIPSFTIPVLAPPTVSHSQILTSPMSQQAVHIAVSSAPDVQHQSVTFLSPSVQPLIRSANQCVDIRPSTTSNIQQQTTPLNLSSTTNQSIQMTRPQMSKSILSFQNTTSGGSNLNLTSCVKLSTSPATTFTTSSGGHPSYLSLINSHAHRAVNSELILPTRPSDWDTQVAAHSATLTPPRRPENVLPDLQNPYNDSHGRDFEFHKTATLAACQSEPLPINHWRGETGTLLKKGHLFRPWNE